MRITYTDITQANEGLSTVDVKGKEYVVVPQRVKAFRKLYPDGFIMTDILSHENGVVVMQAKAGYYDEEGNAFVLGTGLAFEKADSSYINKTSYIENCETSAIGRALGFLGLGIDAAICSAEELINAVSNQDKPARKPEKAAEVKKDAPAEVATVAKVPALSESMQYLNDSLTAMAKATGKPLADIKAIFKKMQIKTVQDGVSPNKALAEYTRTEIQLILDLMKAEAAA